MNTDAGLIGQLTPCTDVNEILVFFTEGAVRIFGGNLAGIYLTGSLSYDAFEYESSDIDLTVILKKPVSSKELEEIGRFHVLIEERFEKWSRRLECSYTPVEMLPGILPPEKPRPWYWGGDRILYAEALYGNEWIINKYLLFEHAIPLIGPSFKELTGPIPIEEVQKACIRDLFKEWEPKRADRDWFKNSHCEAYFILNLCRILYTVMCASAGSKQTAASWVMGEYGQFWSDLVRAARQWSCGIELNLRNEALEFVGFVIDQVSRTVLYAEMIDEIQCIRTSCISARS